MPSLFAAAGSPSSAVRPAQQDCNAVSEFRDANKCEMQVFSRRSDLDIHSRSFLADLNHVENGESVVPIDFQSAICFHRCHYEDGRHCRSTTISTGSIAFEFFMRLLSADYVLI